MLSHPFLVSCSFFSLVLLLSPPSFFSWYCSHRCAVFHLSLSFWVARDCLSLLVCDGALLIHLLLVWEEAAPPKRGADGNTTQRRGGRQHHQEEAKQHTSRERGGNSTTQEREGQRSSRLWSSGAAFFLPSFDSLLLGGAVVTQMM